ncbi:hypothetical protein M6D81_00685 [Paenibacillus sp. J5C_2022]|uniref:nucleotide-binding domain containing protein n=1 Tax=Paenibacillus sp. J5C2022 TaxID=2977129 RepID=UPI0021D3106C|nr:nucleotide-binding domain containing protein [Paenibacillus sp. J5C2022]MCU6707208.1 hypothetical protein [Paenibacillus sp. J5C2022]
MDNELLLTTDRLDERRVTVSAGQIGESARKSRDLLVPGSPEGEYSLERNWRESGIASSRDAEPFSGIEVARAEQVLVVSGSTSAITHRQIEAASAKGFQPIRIPPIAFLDSEGLPMQLLDAAIALLEAGRSVILFTALGPHDPHIAETRELLLAQGVRTTEIAACIGRKLGEWTFEIVRRTPLRRIVIAGGDTSGYVADAMNIYALRMLLPICPGAPMCAVYAEPKELEGLELALKGGEFGDADYFEQVLTASGYAWGCEEERNKKVAAES